METVKQTVEITPRFGFYRAGGWRRRCGSHWRRFNGYCCQCIKKNHLIKLQNINSQEVLG